MKTKFKIILLLSIFNSFALWGDTAREGLIVLTDKGLKLYYFDDDLSSFSKKSIPLKSEIFQVDTTGVIYSLAPSQTLYEENFLPEFGIKLVFIKQPDHFYNFYSGICVDSVNQKMYFPKKEKRKDHSVELYQLNLKTGEEVKLSSGYNFKSIGIPSLSPDKRKIAFYCSIKPYFQLQVAVYNIESKTTKVLAPPSTPIFPYGPYMGGGPVWNDDSSELYFMAIYPEILKKKGIFPAVYRVSTKPPFSLKLISEGGWPNSSNGKIICTLMSKMKSEIGTWRIFPLPIKFIFSGVSGKFSCSGRFVAYRAQGEGELYVKKADEDKKIMLYGSIMQGPDYWWITLDQNDKTTEK